MADDLTWTALEDDSFDELRALAHACLDADGGMPLFIGEQMLRGRMLIGESIAARDASGALVAAASVSVGDSGAITTGMVHPARRGEGLGRRLLRWACDWAGRAPLTVATETLSERAERLYARFRLAEVFAEDVLRHDLSDVPDVPAPEGISLTPVSAAPVNCLLLCPRRPRRQRRRRRRDARRRRRIADRVCDPDTGAAAKVISGFRRQLRESPVAMRSSMTTSAFGRKCKG